MADKTWTAKDVQKLGKDLDNQLLKERSEMWQLEERDRGTTSEAAMQILWSFHGCVRRSTKRGLWRWRIPCFHCEDQVPILRMKWFLISKGCEKMRHFA